MENLHQVLVRALEFKLVVIGSDIEGAPIAPAADHHLVHHLHRRHAHVGRIVGRQIADNLYNYFELVIIEGQVCRLDQFLNSQ